ncbi:tyrosine-type recombinase/integrase [Halostagnicola kamekurae]|uniref:Phage integrase, N-terminal SAM-like domain n=1 Tax=Halostagnicola kamekurae TaxID=619731 RepID=A0A1I6S5A5_9EURY|nr:site-specific integrase [Halostagnicola kamekurae]SFS72116.1 Phage integrase, N-terminal SAM-like domain [Halostagnicola kamekurae]
MLEPITPRQAKELYLEDRTDLSVTSKQNHGYRVERFVEWCEETDLDNLNELTGRKLHEFKVWRSEEVNNVTLQNQLGTIRQFLVFCERIDAVPPGLSEKVELPKLGMNEDVNDTAITPEEAELILEYLNKYEYATLRHVIFHLLWHTGIRTSTLRAFDVTDFHPGEGYIKAVNRESTGTPLKNRTQGEREINLGSGLVQTLNDWVHDQHPRVEDDHGRMPLICTSHGRAHETTIRSHVYKITRPCHYSNKCPHDRDMDECEAVNSSKANFCPSSVSPHAIRKGSITYHRNKGWPVEAVSDRADVSQEVLDKHYDKASISEKRQRRAEFLDRL